MSIINDALKKVQNELQKKGAPDPSLEATATAGNESPAEKTQSHAPVSKNKKSPSKNRSFLYTVGITTILVLLGLISILFRRAELTHTIPPQPKPSRPIAAAKPVVVDNMQINGVVTMDNKRVVLINNEIYEVGDSVQGKEIVNITMDSVDFLENGNILTVQVNKK